MENYRLERDVNDAKNTFDSLIIEIEELEAVKLNLENKIATLSDEIDDLESKLEDANQIIKDLDSQLPNLV